MSLDLYSRIDLLGPRPPGALPMPARFSPVVELRQYTLHPGQREVLIELFDREFVESQEALGAHVLGQFRDRDRPDRFVWLRGYENMRTRREALTAFYDDGPVWRRHREAACATMIDSDNVLLLRPTSPASAFELDTADRARPGDTARIAKDVSCVICHPGSGDAQQFRDFFAGTVAPALQAQGTRVLGSFETETAVNDYPRLPVREGENVFVWFASGASAGDRDPASLGAVMPELARRLEAPPEILRLSPTARSLLRG
jgi:hypothetical protein